MASAIAVSILCIVCLFFLEKSYSRSSPNWNFGFNFFLICVTVFATTRFAMSRPELEVIDKAFVYAGSIILLCLGTAKTYADWIEVKQKIEEERRRLVETLQRAAQSEHKPLGDNF